MYVHVSRGIYNVGFLIVLPSLLSIHIPFSQVCLFCMCDDIPRAPTQYSWNLNYSMKKSPQLIKTTLSFFWNDKSNRYRAFSLKPLETFHEISMNVEGQDHAIFFFA